MEAEKCIPNFSPPFLENKDNKNLIIIEKLIGLNKSLHAFKKFLQWLALQYSYDKAH